ncbi:hypothetical protein BDF20DRAFT_914116 [Mycotypha africana]|uniref:uncharacterized protein n=1 Tax=Mycotypha africana TaxID=64632 RepID=UPI002301B15E|nr:uncharacterized protein BDF20DRAFT_914116 [Mycotypha africana]KAI8975150.1 hypothetical protein BDF20DRAFT_914116 [Mycotypha africana]
MPTTATSTSTPIISATTSTNSTYSQHQLNETSRLSQQGHLSTISPPISPAITAHTTTTSVTKSNTLNEEIRNVVAAVQFNDPKADDEEDEQQKAYKDLIKQLAAQAPEPYGAIPPLLKKKKKKKQKDKDGKKRSGEHSSKKKAKKDNDSSIGTSNQKRRRSSKHNEGDDKVPIRQMSHVENWLALDSKESIPDEEDLIPASPFQNFLSTDFLVLPLHMPPPSLSAIATQREEENRRQQQQQQKQLHLPMKKKSADLRPILYPVKSPNVQVIPIQQAANNLDSDEEEEEEIEDIVDLDDAEDEEDEEDEEEDDMTDTEEESDMSIRIGENGIQMTRKTSIPSFSKSHEPSTSTTNTYAMSTSPPSSATTTTSTTAVNTAALSQSSITTNLQHKESSITSPTTSPLMSPSTSTNITKNSTRWLETIAQLKRSLVLSTSSSSSPIDNNNNNNTAENKNFLNNSKKPPHFIPMPPSPKPLQQRRKRRSEATTQPRFNPETNTYTRDTRSNPDHLRMISAELNMMRHRKLSSPLKPRGFLPRRTDTFIRGENRKLSNLKYEAIIRP